MNWVHQPWRNRILTVTILKTRRSKVKDYTFPMEAVLNRFTSRRVGKTVYQNMINPVDNYVYITTPYLIIDYDLTEDIRNAALRGVDVRIVTPYSG